jgi:CRP-like cAMP-binding protein
MCLSAGSWIGEEVAFAEMPIIYSAIASTDIVRVLQIKMNNFLL